MAETSQVLEYKCPCCGAGLIFGDGVQKMICEYCDNTFDLDTLKAYQDTSDQKNATDFQWEDVQRAQMDADADSAIRSFICQSCGGVLITDENTAATFCPYCESPAVLPERLSNTVQPDAVIPFQTSKEDAQAAFIQLCKKKPLLPKFFAQQHRVEKITGIYIPFWLYDCAGDVSGVYKATRIHTWSDSQYNYTKTDHYQLHRAAQANFEAIPLDGSSKLDDALMESIEPFDYDKMVDFHTAYLSGYFADKYDVEEKAGQSRIEERVGQSLDDELQKTFIGFSSVVPVSRNLNIQHSGTKYVLLC